MTIPIPFKLMVVFRDFVGDVDFHIWLSCLLLVDSNELFLSVKGKCKQDTLLGTNGTAAPALGCEDDLPLFFCLVYYSIAVCLQGRC